MKANIVLGQFLASHVQIVAELSANHGGSLERALATVRAAAAAGADAIKLQTYTADTLTLACDSDLFRVHGTAWAGRTLYDLYREAHTPWSWHPVLRDEIQRAGLEWFSTPFDRTAVEFLETLHVPRYKIASFELVDTPLLRQVGATGKPVVLSTGMATQEEIAQAIRVLRESGSGPVTLLKCTSAYPAPPESMNLLTIRDMRERFGLPTGLSDHTLGIAVPVAAAVMGAVLIEKHFTLRRADGGPDAAFSLEPEEFRTMVDAVRTAERALGTVRYGPTDEEAASLAFRRSLFVVQDMERGEVFDEHNVRSIRPAHGLPPSQLPVILGRKAACAILRGTPLAWNLVA